jgi:hypothetical protein
MTATAKTDENDALLADLQVVAVRHGFVVEQCPCPLHRGYVRLAHPDGREVDTRRLPVTKD